MPKLALIILLFTACQSLFAQDNRKICLQTDELNTQILNNTIKRADAAKQFKQLIAQLKHEQVNTNTRWTFPLQGYVVNSIGGYKGNGYHDKGYNYLDGNKHTAHPAHDIFISDKDQDNLDDRTRKPVNVLAVYSGIVIACSNNWNADSPLRGGKFIWLYHPQLNYISGLRGGR